MTCCSLRRVGQAVAVCSAVGPVRVASFVRVWDPVLGLPLTHRTNATEPTPHSAVYHITVLDLDQYPDSLIH